MSKPPKKASTPTFSEAPGILLPATHLIHFQEKTGIYLCGKSIVDEPITDSMEILFRRDDACSKCKAILIERGARPKKGVSTETVRLPVSVLRRVNAYRAQFVSGDVPVASTSAVIVKLINDRLTELKFPS